ncbi:DUF3023 domain-containing protein [Ehrlichia ruminantium]|uniref:DUF3023 domain-containing protein n=1 Tax=Ehrlichia ruminantium TaxID=779 RepID=A0AAE6QAA0_EHRRU|nr:DUF3023 domain-containing protein [Ehrlichia ruminantium]QGR02609.1 DUF3023 domain-containing protein [Ehrlichia ruminantium]QGR03529.1 DUF3023 domain-containing protein [Ehrlichia ruminantium]QGR04456.1 DUF3023 domain-containing protein [Ehrlichia ruminantium]
MLFKHNPENTEKIHNAVLSCLHEIKMYVYDISCIGNTQRNSVLNIIVSKDKGHDLCERKGRSLLHMKCAISPKRVMNTPSLMSLLKAILHNSIIRAIVDSYIIIPNMEMELYMLIEEHNLSMLTQKYLSPTRNIRHIGEIVLCKPSRVGNGLYNLDLDFDEEAALKKFGGLHDAKFTTLPSPFDASPQARKLFTSTDSYKRLSKKSDKNKTSSTNITMEEMTENIQIDSIEQGASGGTTSTTESPQPIPTSLLLVQNINYFTNIAHEIEHLCDKYP